MAVTLSALDVMVSALFTFFIARQWYERRRPYQLLWAFAMLVWTVAVAAETVAAARGAWNPATYRFYYAFGALMVAPWLGVGSLFLVAPRRWARLALAVTLLLTVVGFVGIFSHTVPAEALAVTDELGFVETRIFPMMPTRLAIILGNIFGSVAFIGGALYSVYGFWKKQIMRDRMIGVALIAAGGMLAAVTHSVGALGGPSLFRVSQLGAVLLIFGGYLITNNALRLTTAKAVIPRPS
jgi:hypothetical protein